MEKTFVFADKYSSITITVSAETVKAAREQIQKFIDIGGTDHLRVEVDEDDDNV